MRDMVEDGPTQMRFDMERQQDPALERPPAERSEASSVGALLRSARMRHGLDLQDVSSALRIRVVHLQAIEEGRFADLPGPTYAVGFVRAYADHLGLDVAEVAARFRSEVSTMARRPELHFPAPEPESRVPSGAVLLISVVLAAAAYGGWYYLTMGGRTGIELVSDVPQRLAQLFGGGSGAPGEAPSAAGAQTPARVAAPGVEALERVLPTTPETEVVAAESAPTGPPPEERVAEETVAALGVGDEGATAAVEPSPPGEGPSPATDADALEPETMAADTEAAPGAAPAIGPAPDEPAAEEPAAEEPDVAFPAIEPETVEMGDAAATDEAAAEGPAEAAPARVPPAAPMPREPAGDGASPPAPERMAAVPAAPMVPAPAETVVTAPPQVFGKANVDARIVIHAKGESWVQVRDGDGALILTRMLREGDSYRVPNRSGLMLLTGNAGALEIYVDGRLAPPIGPGGAIRRDVALDADRLLAGTAVVN